MEAARDCLLGWAFKGGRYELGWGILEHSLYGLAVFALLPDQIGADEKLKHDIQQGLLKKSISQEILDRAARNMREKAATLYRLRDFPNSSIEAVMNQVDETKLKGLLEDIANLLSPNTANEEVNVGFL